MSEETEEVEEVEATEDIKKTIEADGVIRKYLSGGDHINNIIGIELKPITLASLAFMQEAGSELISGETMDDIQNIVLEILLFIYIHTEEHEEISKIICHSDNPKATLREKSFAVGVDIQPNEVPKIVDEIVALLSEATSTKAEPLPTDDDNPKKKATKTKES